MKKVRCLISTADKAVGLSAHALVFPQMIGHGSARLSYLSGHHRLSRNEVNALLGRMGQILLILSSCVDRKNLTTGQRDAAASTS